MSSVATLASLIAQDAALIAQEAAPAAPGVFSPMVLIGGMFFLFYFMVLAPERRKKAQETAMLSQLKKNDRVITIGGIHGTIAAIADDNNVITLKLDEAGTTRIKVNRSAIGTVVGEPAKAAEKS